MNEGPADQPAGRELQAVWVTLSGTEAEHLLASLEYWAERIEEGRGDPGWHTHVTDSDGKELTISIEGDHGAADS